MNADRPAAASVVCIDEMRLCLKTIRHASLAPTQPEIPRRYEWAVHLEKEILASRQIL